MSQTMGIQGSTHGVPAPASWKHHFWVQMTMLIFLNFSQGVMLTMPFTLSVYMVRHFLEEQQEQGVPIDEQLVGRQTGMLAASFSFAQFTTSMLWGVLSNIIGRKTVASFGTFVTGVAMIWYGMCTSYSAALVSRIVAGLLNGVLGAWKCIIGESGDSLKQGKMFGYMSLAWGIGSTAGPLIGGYLSRPCTHYLDFPLCAPGQLFYDRPFALPTLVGGIFILLCSFATMVLLLETLPDSLRQQQIQSVRHKWEWVRRRLPCCSPRPSSYHTTWEPCCASPSVLTQCSPRGQAGSSSPSGSSCTSKDLQPLLHEAGRAQSCAQEVVVKVLVSSDSCPDGSVHDRDEHGRQEGGQGAAQSEAAGQGLCTGRRAACRSISLSHFIVHPPDAALGTDETDGGYKKAVEAAKGHVSVGMSAVRTKCDDGQPPPSAVHSISHKQGEGEVWLEMSHEVSRALHPVASDATISSSHHQPPGFPRVGSDSALSSRATGSAPALSKHVRWEDEQDDLEALPLVSRDSMFSGRGDGSGAQLPGSLQHVDSIRTRMGFLMRAGSRVFFPPAWSPYTRRHEQQVDDDQPLLQHGWSSAAGAAPGGQGHGMAGDEMMRGADKRVGGTVGVQASRALEGGGEREPLLSVQPDPDEPSSPWHKNPQVVLTIAAYALMAFLFCAMDELLPLFASAPVEEGGLGLAEHQLAPAITLFGITLMIYSAWMYPALQRLVGTLRLARHGLLTAVGTCVIIPFAHTLLDLGPTWSKVMLCASMIIKSIAQCNAFTGALVMVNAAPHKSQLGSVNGVGQTLAALVRGLGPAMGGVLWSLTLTLEVPGQQYIPFVIVSLLAVSSFLVYGHVYLPNLK